MRGPLPKYFVAMTAARRNHATVVASLLIENESLNVILTSVCHSLFVYACHPLFCVVTLICAVCETFHGDFSHCHDVALIDCVIVSSVPLPKMLIVRTCSHTRRQQGCGD